MKFAAIVFVAILSFSTCSMAQNTLQWARGTMGGSEGWLATTDKDGNVYSAGHTYGTTTKIYFGSTAFHYSFNEIGAIMVKYDPQGNVLWATSNLRFLK